MSNNVCATVFRWASRLPPSAGVSARVGIEVALYADLAMQDGLDNDRRRLAQVAPEFEETGTPLGNLLVRCHGP